MAAMAAGWFSRDVFAGKIAGGKDDEDGRNDAGDDAHLEEDAAVLFAAAFQQIERADGGHDEGAGDDCAGHVVHVLQRSPGIQSSCQKLSTSKWPSGMRV